MNKTKKAALQCFKAGLLVAAGLAMGSAMATEAPSYQAGIKYSPLDQINRENVANLELAWEFHTGDVAPQDLSSALVSFQDQPSLIEGNLVVCTIHRRVIALDPATGEERWAYDPETRQVGARKCRGVAHWVDREAEPGAVCQSRILFATSDNRLVAIDARTGKPCAGFGNEGEVQVPSSKPTIFDGEVVLSSRPGVVNDTVVVGGMVADNQRENAPSGRVMAYHARTGEFLWEFDPIPRDPDDPAMVTWERGSDGHGGGNVWTEMAADDELDLIYLPTSAPSGDFYGGNRPGDNLYSSSVVALRGTTGEVVWHQQLVRHDVFDYDLPAQPLLIDYPHNGRRVPALVQNTKMGLVFVFDRATGEPLVPIVDRAVPQTGKVASEKLSPTQPFPEGMPPLVPHTFTPEDAWGFTFIDRWLCKRKIEQLNHGSIYMPPSEKGTIFSPAAGGGPNWGGGAYDPDSQVMVVPTNRVPMVVSLLPSDESEPFRQDDQIIEGRGIMTFANAGAPYKFRIEPLMSPLGAPCSAPPWAALTAVDIVKKEILWEVPLGDLRKLAPIPVRWELGTPGAGGPLVTAGGLVFIGYTLDDVLRAFDLKTGEVVWETDLPAAGTAVPVSYEVNGEQYIVIAAGGHSMYGSTLGDSVVAYRLKR